MPGLITSGRMWISEPPLYRVKASSGITYLKDDEALEAFKKEKQKVKK